MANTDYAHDHLEHMVTKFEQVYGWVDDALATVAEAEMRELAKRFPNRRIELHSGMGSTFLTISKRHPNDALDYWSYHGETGTSYLDWPEYLPAPAARLWEAIAFYEDNISNGKDPGFGTIIYENGKKIAGTSAGGKCD